MRKVVLLLLFALLLPGLTYAQSISTPIPQSEVVARFKPFVGVWNVISCPDDPKQWGSSSYQLELSVDGSGKIHVNEPYYYNGKQLTYHPDHPYIVIDFTRLQDKEN